MDEQGEIPSKEQVVVSPELEAALEGAKQRVVSEAQQPQTDILERTAGLGFVSAMKEAIIPHAKKLQEVAFKDLKAAIMAAISLVPIVSSGATAARAAGKAARLEAQSVKMAAKAEKVAKSASVSGRLVTKEIAVADAAAWKAGVKAREALNALVSKFSLAELNQYKTLLVKGVDSGLAARIALLPVERAALFEKEIKAGVSTIKAYEHARRGIDTLATKGVKILGKDFQVPTGKIKYGARMGAERVGETWLHKALHTLDPYPDVPGLVSMVGLLDLIPGVVGAELVPAAWQLITNRIQGAKAQFALERDVSKVILSRMGVKFQKMKEPQVARAAEVFVPAPAQAAA